MVYTNNIISVKVYYCENADENLVFAIYQFVILFVAPGLVMMVCYVYVIRELWRSTRNINILTNSRRSVVIKFHVTHCMRDDEHFFVRKSNLIILFFSD